jgi:hypothetical protein
LWGDWICRGEAIRKFPMSKRIEQFPPLAIAIANKAWVVKELDALLKEWRRWGSVVQDLGDSPDFDPQTCTEALLDGRDNLRKHDILREKTLVFLRNHFTGAEFIFENWPSHPHEDNTSRLRRRVPNWIHRLEMLAASVGYARVPDGFWKERGKELVTTLSKTAPEKAIDVAASFLKNPFGG